MKHSRTAAKRWKNKSQQEKVTMINAQHAHTHIRGLTNKLNSQLVNMDMHTQLDTSSSITSMLFIQCQVGLHNTVA